MLGYVSSNFDDKPLAVVECLRVLFVATFSLEGHPGSQKNQAGAAKLSTQKPSTDKPGQDAVYAQLMLEPSKHALFSPLSSRHASGEASSWHSSSGAWSRGGWDVAIKDVTTRQTPLQMNVVLKYVRIDFS
jgi:hypothetical protein